MAASLFGLACSRASVDYKTFPSPAVDLEVKEDGPATIVVSGGCFWCTEGVFEQIPGVSSVVSGYSGGTKESADYGKVSNGETGHAEAIRITYDPKQISFGQVLKVFFAVAHDPTTVNRQGNDIGRQYRSAIFFANDDEKRVAEAYIKQLDEAKVFAAPIATTLEGMAGFYEAEQYHQDYVRLHPNEGYVSNVAIPKVEKAKRYVKESTPSTRPATN